MVYEKIITDEVSTTVTYIGYAENDFALTSDAVWAIQKIESASATTPQGVTTFSWADSPEKFSNIWDNRLTLTYRS